MSAEPTQQGARPLLADVAVGQEVASRRVELTRADLVRYAGASGDRNPIHLYGVTAKAFGFPRQIAHGMWTKARSIAAVENRLPEAVTVEVSFKTPVLLPTTVRFASTAAVDDRGVAFSLVNPKNDAPHLAGRTSAPA